MDPARPHALTLSDGSTVRVDPDTALHITDHHAGGSLITLTHGGALFEVTPRQDAPFIVEAGPVRVVVLGTRFRVAREADGVSVRVDSGRVRVEHPGGQALLTGGDERHFPFIFDNLPPKTPTSNAPHLAAPSAAQRALAAQSLRDGLLHGLLTPPAPAPAPAPAPPKPKPTASDLAAAADAARAAGDPALATRLLSQLLRDHPRSRYVSAASLTLAKLLTQAGRPCDAAETLAQAQAALPADPLTQDLLAREVEALLRCGQPERARARADAYLSRYPDGAHAPRVRDLIHAPDPGPP